MRPEVMSMLLEEVGDDTNMGGLTKDQLWELIGTGGPPPGKRKNF